MKQLTLFSAVMIQAFLGIGVEVVLAQANYSGNTVTCLTNATQFQHDGEYVVLTNKIRLAAGIEVSTNCTFQVNEGKDRPLREGQILRADGFLLSADGSIVPVRDHIAMSKGVVMVYKDGQGSPITTTLTLPDGTGINPDGSYEHAGRRSRLADGQLIGMDGIQIQGFETVSLRGGKVTVYKDGAIIPLESALVIIGMADSSRVRGDGQITSADGTTSQLDEGEVITKPALRRDW
jgi:hypothetical protein